MDGRHATGSKSNRIARLGIIGCGSTARRYLLAPSSLHIDGAGKALHGVSGRWSVEAVMDPDVQIARQLAREVLCPRTYGDHWDLLGDDSIDAVLITSPAWIRSHQALEALEAGKHVLCHAPSALYLEDCDRLTRTAEERGLIATSGFRLRYVDVVSGAVRLIGDGLIGEPVLVRCDRSTYVPKGVRQNGPATWQERFSLESVETADLCSWILGAPLTVSADVQQAQAASRKPEDIGNVIVQHERGLSIHHISRVSHQTPVERYLIDGVEATMVIERQTSSTDPFTVSLFRQGKLVRMISEECARAGAGVSALLEFHDRIVTGSTPDTGRSAVECVSAALLSSVENRKVNLPLLSGPAPSRLLPAGDPRDARRAIR